MRSRTGAILVLSIGAVVSAPGCGSSPSGGANASLDGGCASSSGSGASSGGGGSGGDPFGGADAANRCVNGTMCPSNECPATSYTTITGTVYDPAGKNPLPFVAVYIPQHLTNGALDPLPLGASCSDCAALFTNTVLASAITKGDGTFTITGPNVPVGQALPLVVQTGKWRRLYSVTVNPCTNNTAAQMLRLPGKSSEGDLPHIAISTGGADSLECLLSRIGVDDSEYVDGASMKGHIHIFQGGTTGDGNPGPTIDSATPISSDALWDSVDDLQKYDVVLLSCEGAPTASTQPENLDSYVKDKGGRVFASHFHYQWFADASSSFINYDLASWRGGTCDSGDVNDVIQTTLLNGHPFAKGQGMETWMETVGGATKNSSTGAFEFPVTAARHNATVTQQNPNATVWVVGGPDVASVNPTGSCPEQAGVVTSAPAMTQYFSWDEPIGSSVEKTCGRIVYSDLHVGAASNDYGGSMVTSSGVVPTECMHGAKLSPQEDVLEFMLFDLSSCLTPANSEPAPPAVAQ